VTSPLLSLLPTSQADPTCVLGALFQEAEEWGLVCFKLSL
jgi:hypothetical protein